MTARRWRWVIVALWGFAWAPTTVGVGWVIGLDPPVSWKGWAIWAIAGLVYGWCMTTQTFRDWPGRDRVPAADRWDVFAAAMRGRPAPGGLEDEVIDLARHIQGEARRSQRHQLWLLPAALAAAGAVHAVADRIGPKSMTLWAGALVLTILVPTRPWFARRRAARAQKAESLAAASFH